MKCGALMWPCYTAPAYEERGTNLLTAKRAKRRYLSTFHRYLKLHRMNPGLKEEFFHTFMKLKLQIPVDQRLCYRFFMKFINTFLISHCYMCLKYFFFQLGIIFSPVVLKVRCIQVSKEVTCLLTCLVWHGLKKNMDKKVLFLKKWSCQSHPSWQLLTFWVSTSLEVQKSPNCWFPVRFVKIFVEGKSHMTHSQLLLLLQLDV